MTPQDFVYWLQGYLEIQDPKTINEQQIQIIKDHIALVLKKETPNRGLKPAQDWVFSDPLLSWPTWIGQQHENFKSDPPIPDSHLSNLTKTTFGGSC